MLTAFKLGSLSESQDLNAVSLPGIHGQKVMSALPKLPQWLKSIWKLGEAA